MFRKKIVTIAVIILALILASNAIGQKNKRKRITKKANTTRSSAQRKSSSTSAASNRTQNAKAKSRVWGDPHIEINKNSSTDATTENQGSRGDTTSGDVVVTRRNSGVKDGTSNTAVSGQDTASSDASMPKLQEENTKRKIKTNGADIQGEGTNQRTQNPNSGPSRPDIPKPEIHKIPITKPEKPTKTEQPKRANRRPRRRSKNNN